MTYHILFITSITMYAGGEVWMVTMMEYLRRRGHRISLICRPDATIQPYAERAGAHIYPMKMRGDLDPICICRTRSILKKESIDIIITNMDKELRFAGLAAKLSGRVVVINRKGVDRPLKNKFHYRYTYNQLATSVVANSEATKKTLLKNAPWLDSQRIEVIYNGIETERFDPAHTRDLRQDLGLSPGVHLAGFVGRLNCQKGIETLLNAFHLASQKNKSLHLLIVGEGDLRQMVESFTREFSLEEKVHITGFRDDIPDIMRTIDVLILPSLWEGFGIVLIEAMAACKPCITTEVSSMPEIVEDGVSGIVVPSKNSEALAQAIGLIVKNPKLAKKMGKRGRVIVGEKFHIEGMVDAYEALFDSLVLSLHRRQVHPPSRST